MARTNTAAASSASPGSSRRKTSFSTEQYSFPNPFLAGLVQMRSAASRARRYLGSATSFLSARRSSCACARSLSTSAAYAVKKSLT